MAYAYQAVGRLEEAIDLYETALAVCQRVLGDKHSLTSAIRANLNAARQSGP
ncbi:tetratricopeptide repeat protein [Virgisporangium ochraceum]|uniref:tetratricopeptide repeat protein n=1 Tax=Virgisporangium ochraceum TaxID=65505 RepID=UPI0023B26217|nr:tetratricopeptide repeat protein [Virgisporangium ochraceum]